jgi:hypothetical protein
MTNGLHLGNTLPRGVEEAPQALSALPCSYFIHIESVVRFGEKHMKKVLISLAAASIALVSVQAFAQASDAAAPAAAAPAKHHHSKKLKTHGKRAGVSAAASAAGTNDKGTQN